MSSAPEPPDELTNPPEPKPASETDPRWALAWLPILWALRVGLIGGLLCGWSQALAQVWRHGLPVGLRQWPDVLSYAGLSHGVLWMANGVLCGVVVGLAILASRRLRRALVPEAFAVAVLAASASSFVLWPFLGSFGLKLASGLQLRWCAIMAAYWGIAAVAVYAITCQLAQTRFGHYGRRILCVTFWPAAAILLICAGIQWFERPRLLELTTGWRQSSPAPAGESTAPPNVVLIVLDTQRVDRFGCYGYARPTTPRLDAFAEDARVFEKCISAAPWTIPSHASMFTGLFPSEHGATYNHWFLADRFSTMAELLRETGYETIAFITNGWLLGPVNATQGFDRVVAPHAIHTARSNSVHRFMSQVLYPADGVGALLGRATSQDQGAKYTGQLVSRWLRERDSSRPFFLFINYIEPHSPHRAHLPYRRLFVEPDEIDASYRCNWDKLDEFELLKRDCYSSSELKLLNDVYDAETRLLDDYVGELLEILAESVPIDDSLVIITSDHGDNLGDHHRIGHRTSVYDTLAHVPLIVRYPKYLQPGRTKTLVQLTDLFPTVMHAVHGKPVSAPSAYSRSLLLPLDADSEPNTDGGPTTAPRTYLPTGPVAVCERIAPYGGALANDARFDRTPFIGVLRSIQQGDWKYIISAAGNEELYNVAADPGETANLIQQHRPIADHLAERLEEWLAALQPYEPDTAPAPDADIDEDIMRQLSELGYVQ